MDSKLGGIEGRLDDLSYLSDLSYLGNIDAELENITKVLNNIIIEMQLKL